MGSNPTPTADGWSPRFVTSPNHIDHGRRRKGSDRRGSSHRPSIAVTERGPEKEVATKDDPRVILLPDHRPVGKVREPGLVQSLPPAGIDSFCVQRPVDVVDPG